jgi:hypothetical protein
MCGLLQTNQRRESIAPLEALAALIERIVRPEAAVANIASERNKRRTHMRDVIVPAYAEALCPHQGTLQTAIAFLQQ